MTDDRYTEQGSDDSALNTPAGDVEQERERDRSAFDAYMRSLFGDEEEEEEKEEEHPQEPEEDKDEQPLPLKEKDDEKHIRAEKESLPELEYADQGLAVRLGHEGQQHLDELLLDENEREQTKETDYGFESQVDEDAINEKKEKFEKKDRELRERDKEYYKRQERREIDEYYDQQARGIEAQRRQESEYDRQMRARYELQEGEYSPQQAAHDAQQSDEAGAPNTRQQAPWGLEERRHGESTYDRQMRARYEVQGSSRSFAGIQFEQEESRESKEQESRGPEEKRKAATQKEKQIIGGYKKQPAKDHFIQGERKDHLPPVKEEQPAGLKKITGRRPLPKEKRSITDPTVVTDTVHAVKGRGITPAYGGYVKGIISGSVYREAREAQKKREENARQAAIQRELPGIRTTLGEWRPSDALKKRPDKGIRLTATEELYAQTKARNKVITIDREEAEEDKTEYPDRGRIHVPGGREGGRKDRINTRDHVLNERMEQRLNARKTGFRTESTLAGRRKPGALAEQSASMKGQMGRRMRYLAKNGRTPGADLATGALEEAAGGSVAAANVRRVIIAAVKKIAAGITAAAIGVGVVTGGGAYKTLLGEGLTTYYYPIQAHTQAAEGSDVTMTQEVMNGMTDRMKAYGIPLSQESGTVAGNGMIRIHIPGFKDTRGDTRWGDCQIITDGSGNCLIIDGGCGRLSDAMIEYLKSQGITRVSLLVTHWHDDHSWGFVQLIRETDIHVDRLYCFPPSEIAGIEPAGAGRGDELISHVTSHGGDVIYIQADRLSQITFGSLRMTMWRTSDPGRSKDSSTTVNDMSIQVYFPDLYYYTTGDVIYEMPKFLDLIRGATIKCFKVPHHGNGGRNAMSMLKDYGAEISWDNNLFDSSHTFELGTRAASSFGIHAMETNGDIEMTAGGGTMTVTGDGQTYSYRIPYMGGGSAGTGGGLMQQVCDYAASWAGKIPYGSAWNGTDPNNERWLPLQEGRPSDCSWFVYWCLYHFGLVGEDFIHSYEWGNDTEKYAEFGFVNVGTDMSTAIPGDVICTGAGTASNNSHVAIYIGDGKVAECGAGVGTTISNAPSSPRQIVRYMGSTAGVTGAGIGTVMMSSNNSPASDTLHGFSAETEKIVEQAEDDFDLNNYDAFMESKGGEEAYIRSLGGVFAKWVGRDAHVQSASELQEIAEYVFGLETIWGVDYAGGSGWVKWNDDAAGGKKYGGRYYANEDWYMGGLRQDISVEEVLFGKEHTKTIDCQSGVNRVLIKAGLYYGDSGMSSVSTAENRIKSNGFDSRGGKVIYNKNELQVGDYIELFKGGGFSNWRHVCLVGEIKPDGTVITYDGGNRYVRTTCYKKIFDVDSSNAPTGDYGGAGYVGWFGVRMHELKQDGSFTSGTTSIATQDLKEIKVNSVKVDGNTTNKKSVKMSSLGSFTYNGVKTTSTRVNYKFVDKDGNVLGTSASGGAMGMGMTGSAGASGDAAKVLKIAASHMGGPYKWGGDDWESGVDCSHFVTKVMREAGVYDGPYMTSYQWADYGREVPDLSQAQAGDIIISNSGNHVSIYDGEKWVYEAKGAKYGCVHDRMVSSIVTIRRILPDRQSWQATGGSGASGAGSAGAYGRGPAGNGQAIDIPEGLGDKYSFMAWSTVTDRTSNQHRFREQAGEKYDQEGFAVVNGRYVIACAATYGKVGDYVDFVKTDGNVFRCVIGDIKSKGDAGYNKWGHKNGHNIIEFIVDHDSWYNSGHDNPGTASCHPEWKGYINRAVNLGSYFDDPNATLAGGMLADNLMGGGNGCDNAAMTLKKQILSMSALGSYYADPVDMEKYGKYCYDNIDYAVCDSHGADVEYKTIETEDESYMTCEATVTIVCSTSLMEQNDKHYTSWDTKKDDGDPMPAHYMQLTKDVFETIFNVDTTVTSQQGMAGGDPNFEKDEEKEVYRCLRDLGYGPAQIAGMMANIYFESGFRPDADNGVGAHGLFQWMGGRFANLQKLATSKGVEWTTIKVQCEYAYEETHGGSGWSGYTAQKDKFESTTDPYEAGVLFSRYWERHGTNADAIRGKKAKEYYDIIMSAGSGSSVNYVQWAINTANDDSHGYNMNDRNGSPDYDCSSFVFYSLKNSGYDVGNSPFGTGSMTPVMQRIGFENVPINSASDLQPGDIVWWDGAGVKGHTEIYIGDGKFVGAHSNYDGKKGDGDGREIRIDTMWTYNWFQAWRKR